MKKSIFTDLNKLRTCIFHQKTSFITQNTKHTTIILKIFLKYNLIDFYVKILLKNKSYFKIFLSTHKNNLVLKYMYSYSFNKYIFILAGADIKKLSSNFFIFSTTKGFLTKNESIKKHVGGLVVCKFVI